MDKSHEFEELRLDKRAVRRNFDRAAFEYQAHADLQADIARDLLERCDILNINPTHVLDLGAGTGNITRGLLKRFARAQGVALDFSCKMLRCLAQQLSWRQRWQKQVTGVCGDAESLPLASGCFDLVVSNLTLQWCNDSEQVFREVRRVLKSGGWFLFTTFGPDTLKELRTAWHSVDAKPHVNLFLDMHDLGDALLRAGFRDPVMDVERTTRHYPQLLDLLHALKVIGAGNATGGRSRGLMGKQQLQQLQLAYEGYRVAAGLPVSYEVIFGCACLGETATRQQWVDAPQ